MRGIAGLFGATLMMLVLTTCGTYRAITDDYRSDAPVVQSVKPTAGVSGEEVTFDVEFCASLQLKPTGTETYHWDFGGGAYPNVSYDASPAVQLRDGLRGPYTCSVTISGGCVGDPDLTSKFEFPLDVAPITVVSVAPLVGTGKQTATFSVLVGTGNVTSYQWDFGGACSPGGSTEATPSVVFTDVQSASIFQARVIVSNQFEALEVPFTINVLPNPTPGT
jgi:PKD repeat protein